MLPRRRPDAASRLANTHNDSLANDQPPSPR